MCETAQCIKKRQTSMVQYFQLKMYTHRFGLGSFKLGGWMKESTAAVTVIRN